MNAWNRQFSADLLEVITEVTENPEVRAVLITGAGRAFSSGADLKEAAEDAGGGPVDVYKILTERYHPLITGIRRMPKPVIAGVNGPAAGIGLSLALACDLVVAADGVHSVTARRLGLNAGWPARAVALDMMEETPRETLRDVDPDTLWVAYGYEPSDARRHPAGTGAAEGYAYIFPKRDHVNVGIGYVLSYYRNAVSAAPYHLQRQLV
jgi:hypothetical protein